MIQINVSPREPEALIETQLPEKSNHSSPNHSSPNHSSPNHKSSEIIKKNQESLTPERISLTHAQKLPNQQIAQGYIQKKKWIDRWKKHTKIILQIGLFLVGILMAILIKWLMR
jgi:hypothetical protein